MISIKEQVDPKDSTIKEISVIIEVKVLEEEIEVEGVEVVEEEEDE